MSADPCGCRWDSGPYTTHYCEQHRDDDPDWIIEQKNAEIERLRAVLIHALSVPGCIVEPEIRRAAQDALSRPGALS